MFEIYELVNRVTEESNKVDRHASFPCTAEKKKGGGGGMVIWRHTQSHACCKENPLVGLYQEHSI